MLVGAVFVFSGLVKCIDPVGTAIKLTDYFRVLDLGLLAGWSLELAWILCLSEFVVGMLLLFGRGGRPVAWLALLYLLVFTPLTLWLALTDAVSDCGCFGDAVVLTNWQTFWKNVVLLVGVAWLCCRRRPVRPLVRAATFTLPFYCSLAVAVWLCWMGSARVPYIDFRPYRPGVDIAEAAGLTGGADGGEETYGAIYERDGVRREFSLDSLPDEADGWEFVDQVVHRAAAADEPPLIRDFFVRNAEGEDITEALLADTSYLFLLVSPSLDLAAEHDVDRIESIYEYANEHGYGFTCLTVRDDAQINRWRFRTGAEYPMVFSDATILETIVRSNPGLVLLRRGTILWKQCLPWVDVEELTSAKLSEQSAGEIRRIDRRKRVFLLLALLFGPFALFLLFEIKPQKRKRKTMRKKIVAGNWKMNTTLQEGVALAEGLKTALAGKKVNCDVVVCTPFISIASVVKAVEGSIIGVGAENCADHDKGAYTGEVSAAMVASTGAKYVILGHSERRQYYGETNEMLTTKVQLALQNGLTPIFCVGEVKEERENGTFKQVIEAQMKALYGLSAADFAKVVIAYEPVWAIGTGLTATSAQAEEVHAFIRKSIAAVYGAEVADGTSILYGGSCKGDNAPELFAQPDIDGGLIGGAALKVETFMPIIEAWK